MPPGRAGRFDRFHAIQQSAEYSDRLRAGDVLTDALVEPHAEADVTGRVAIEIEDVGIGPATGIVVRRAEEHQDFVARRNDDIVDRGGVLRRAEEGLHR